jgi:hypothetical protein
MLLTVCREWLSDKSTGGEYFIDGDHMGFTLELPVKDGYPGSAIPPTGENSSYLIKLLPSPKFEAGKDPWVKIYAGQIPHVIGLPPYRSDILIHWGNEPENTAGCILVGLTRTPDFIGESRTAFAQLWTKLKEAELSGEPIQLKIFGGTPNERQP